MMAESLSLPLETVEQIKFILKRLFDDGRRWVKGIASEDWRHARYYGSGRASRRGGGGGPPVDNISSEIHQLLGYVEKDATAVTASAHQYILVKADSQCLAGNGLALLRPVLKTNFDNRPQLNFHVWFHSLAPSGGGDHLMVGWRLEGPEGGGSAHDFFHAQPLRKYGAQETQYGLPVNFSESFPTIPLPASNIVELCLTAVLVACGKDALREFVRASGNPAVRQAANDFWSKIFGGSNQSEAR